MQFLFTRRFWLSLAVGLGVLVALALVLSGVMAWRMESALRERAKAIGSFAHTILEEGTVVYERE